MPITQITFNIMSFLASYTIIKLLLKKKIATIFLLMSEVYAQCHFKDFFLLLLRKTP